MHEKITVTTTCDYLPYEVAKRSVEEFARESERLHDLECKKCEKLLESGIRAQEFLKNAREFLVVASREGIKSVSQEAVNAFYFLYKQWLAPCQKAEKWIAELSEKGVRPENLHRFRNATQHVESIVAVDSICRASDESMFEDVAETDRPPILSFPPMNIPLMRLPERQ